MSAQELAHSNAPEATNSIGSSLCKTERVHRMYKHLQKGLGRMQIKQARAVLQLHHDKAS
jgi:hypothetical protein